MMTDDITVVRVSDSWPGDCEFETRLRQFFSGLSSPRTSAETCEKCGRRLWKESCVSAGVRKQGNTCTSLTAMIWP